jgi:hypothetical protein
MSILIAFACGAVLGMLLGAVWATWTILGD